MRYSAPAVVLALGLVIAGCGTRAGTIRAATYGKAIPAGMAVTTARQILESPAAYEGKDVLVAGTITSECPSGGWIWVKDETAQIYVNMHPTNVYIPQKVGARVRAMGKVVLESGQPQVVAYGLEL
jgi:hypothetical protein